MVLDRRVKLTAARHHGIPRISLALLAAGALLAGTSGGVAAAAPPAVTAPLGTAGGQADYARAAREFGVPAPLLLAYAYTVTQWEDHGGAPSAQGGYGPLHLTSPTGVIVSGRDGVARPVGDAPAQTTLRRAAALLGLTPERLRTDVTQNIRGGAALLADEARAAGTHPVGLAGWEPVLHRLLAPALVSDVYDTLRTGANHTTIRGQRLMLAPQALPAMANIAPPTGGSGEAAECPAKLDCRFVPAAYAWNNRADANDYGNYDPAARPGDGDRVRYIVVHDTEGSYDSTVSWLQDPHAYVSAHYVIRSADGAVTQMVRTKDVAWHAGNWALNAHSIGIEHEAYAAEGATWYTDAMYRSSATLVRYLAHRYRIPLDRAHILGHDEVANDSGYAASHWDPGPFWDWDRYFQLLGAPVARPAGDLVTVSPTFATNQYPTKYCPGSGDCRELPAQANNSVLLRTEPRDDAPLITDPVIKGGTVDIADWSDKAGTGRRFAVADRQGEWTAIWFGGQRAWLRSSLLRPARGMTVRAIAADGAPVFSAALPEPAEWPAGTPAGNPTTPPTTAPLYRITPDQRYALVGVQPAEYYYARFDEANVPANHTIVRGAQTYYRISFNHRYLYVRATDVRLE